MELIHYDVYIEGFGQVNFYLGIGIKVLTAVFLGLIIGLDREKKFKSAGIKTQIMICVGATIYTAISILNIDLYGHGPNIDPNRLPAQIVSGIGFLGAGAIIQSRGAVLGLTTAATIWVVAAIGMSIGSGYVLSSSFFTVTILVILNLIEPILKFLGKEELFHVEIRGNKKMVKSILRYIDNSSMELLDSEVFHSEEDERCNFHIEVKSGTKDMKKFIAFTRSNDRIENIIHRAVRKSSY